MISVIVPLYKGKKYIKSIVDMMIRNKKFLDKYCVDEISIELVFVNDYPEQDIFIDTTTEIICRVLCHSNNEGIHKSRVDGLVETKGDYIVFLDQDDKISDDYFYTQIKKLREQNADWVICNGLFRNNRLIYSCDQDVENLLNENHYFSDLTEIISPGQVMLKKSIIPDIWRDNILRKNYCDDAFLWLLLKNNGYILAYNDNEAYFHIEDGNNTSFSWRKNGEALSELKRVILCTNCLNPENTFLFCKAIEKEITKHNTFGRMDDIFKRLIGKNIGKNILSITNGYQIIIYGYGVWGRKLYRLIDNNGIRISAVIDMNIKGIIDGVIVYSPNEIGYHVSNTDNYLMIITPLICDDDINNIISSCGVRKYITITEMLNRLDDMNAD